MPYLLRPRPNSGKFWLDVTWLIVIACFQCSILPSITGSVIYIDLLTSWLTVSVIRQDLFRGFILAAITALALETHSTLPAGIYFCIYGVIVAVVANLKDPFSWMHNMPWSVSIILANLWAVVFEVIVLAILNDGMPFFEWRIVLVYLSRLAFSIPFGLLLAQREIKALMQ